MAHISTNQNIHLDISNRLYWLIAKLYFVHKSTMKRKRKPDSASDSNPDHRCLGYGCRILSGRI